jgi:hypothetical protein
MPVVRLCAALAAPRTFIWHIELPGGDRSRRPLWVMTGRTCLQLLSLGDDVPIKKPAPDVHIEALSRLELSASECLAIEDYSNGTYNLSTSSAAQYRGFGLHDAAQVFGVGSSTGDFTSLVDGACWARMTIGPSIRWGKIVSGGMNTEAEGSVRRSGFSFHSSLRGTRSSETGYTCSVLPRMRILRKWRWLSSFIELNASL